MGFIDWLLSLRPTPESGCPEEHFQRLLAELQEALGPCGFKRRRQNFVLDLGACWSVINAQKSTASTASAKLFTINLAVASKPLLLVDGKPPRAPSESECHWRRRIGTLRAWPRDHWWEIRGDRSYRRAAAEVVPLVGTKAAPLLAAIDTATGLPPLCASDAETLLRHRAASAARAGEWPAAEAAFAALRVEGRAAGAEEFEARVKSVWPPAGAGR